MDLYRSLLPIKARHGVKPGTSHRAVRPWIRIHSAVFSTSLGFPKFNMHHAFAFSRPNFTNPYSNTHSNLHTSLYWYWYMSSAHPLYDAEGLVPLILMFVSSVYLYAANVKGYSQRLHILEPKSFKEKLKDSPESFYRKYVQVSCYGELLSCQMQYTAGFPVHRQKDKLQPRNIGMNIFFCYATILVTVFQETCENLFINWSSLKKNIKIQGILPSH